MSYRETKDDDEHNHVYFRKQD